jgi:hypothetical protein
MPNNITADNTKTFLMPQYYHQQTLFLKPTTPLLAFTGLAGRPYLCV